MAPLAYGDVETAREIVQTNLRALADVAREGFPIICSEPTAALMFRHDALGLVDDPDLRLVAAQTVELTAYLRGSSTSKDSRVLTFRGSISSWGIMCRAI